MRYRRENLTGKGQPIGIDGIWHTSPGKRFGQQIRQVLEFANKGYTLTILSSAYPFVQAVIQGMAGRSFSKVIEESEKKPPPQDIRVVAEMEDLVGRVKGMNLKEGFEAVPSAKDRPWYFSLTIFAVYTYLDVYTKSLVTLVESNQHLSSLLEGYLSEAAKSRSDLSRPAAVRVRDMKRFGIERRVSTIENGLSISPVLASTVDSGDMDILRRGFSTFIEIRGKAAHSNPRLDHEEYTFKDLEKDLEGLVVDVSELDGFVEKIGFTQYGLSSIKDETANVAQVLKKVRLMLLMAVVYPALIDAVLHVMTTLRTEESD